MKITCVIHSLHGGGAERVMAGLASRLQARGHEVSLITLDDGRDDLHEVDAGVVRIPLKVMTRSRGLVSSTLNTIRRIRMLRRAVRCSNATVVLSFCDATNVLVLLATRGLGVPVVVSERSDPAMQLLPWPWRSLRPKLYRFADEVVVLTKTAAKVISPWCKAGAHVIASAVEIPPKMEANLSEKGEQRVLVGVGRLEHEKGFDRLIRAFSKVASQYPQWQLKLYGEGTQRTSLEELVRSLNLGNRVEMHGWVKPIWPVLNEADLFVLPSRYEGFPSALLEAMAAGLACISVDCESGPREIVRHEVDGLLVGNDEQAIERALTLCMGNESLRKKLGQAARSVTDRFGWEAMTLAYECVLNRFDRQSSGRNR